MIRLDTIDEVHAFLRDYATAEHHAAAMPPLSEAEIAAVAESPAAPAWCDDDIDAIYAEWSAREFADECDPDGMPIR